MIILFSGFQLNFSLCVYSQKPTGKKEPASDPTLLLHKEVLAMTLTPSMMPPLKTPAPDFKLPDTGGNTVFLKDFSDKPALLVAFISQHCPYTKHILPALVNMIREYQPKGLAAVGINANDPSQHEEDRPERMAQAAKELEFSFPFLVDASQEVAKAYQAACTPDFFLYDKNRKLAYRGRFDDARPDNDLPVTGNQLHAAVEAVLAGEKPSKTQKPSVGCNIKWKPGNEPEYFLKQQKEYA
jgi:peroxiredoxin